MNGVSAFIVGTIPVHPKLYSDVFHSMQIRIMAANQLHHLFPCGSSLEFYVQPINSCIGDIDTLICKADELAFTDDVPVLPDDVSGFTDTIYCVQILPRPDYPGFVKLLCLGKMRYNWTSKMFEFQQACWPRHLKRMTLIRNLTSSGHIADPEYCCRVTGPAFKLIQGKTYSADGVLSVWCPQWPKEAKHWPFRERRHGWPTSANIRKIVQRGCHVVNGKHPACRNDIFQCRLSFSGAEVCLLQSWTPLQQIVYHMLRFLAKSELIKKDCPKEDEVLSTYHFKTLMMWSCEETPQDWWNSLSVIEICCHLLRKLSEWLELRHCPSYFIPEANLFHERMNKKVVNETIRRLNELCHSDILTGWFAEKYIVPILSLFPNFRDFKYQITDFGQDMLDVCETMDEGKLIFFDWMFRMGYCRSVQHTIKDVNPWGSYAFIHHIQNFHCATKLLQKTIDLGSFLSTVEFSTSFPQFVKVLSSLHAANALCWQQITYDSNLITEFVRELSWQSKVLKSKHHNFPRPNGTSLERSFVLFLTSQGLMENFNGTLSPPEFRLVFQISKGLLGKALECEDSKSKTIASSALAYMAALHFATSDYETTIELCSTLIFNETSEEEEKETLNAGCLLYIEDIASIIGFYLLFRQIKFDFHYKRRLHLLDLRITPEVFALYLNKLCKDKLSRYFRTFYDLRIQKFPLDEILMNITNWRSSGISKRADRVLRVYQKTNPINKAGALNKNWLINEDDVIRLLLEYSLENMTSFYNAICKDFGIHCNTADCYRAAHLYNCLNYPEVLHLCERILDEPDLRSDLSKLVFANVIVMTPLDTYFDNGVQCLLGFHTLFCYLFARNEHLWKTKGTNESEFQNIFTRDIYFGKSPLSYILYPSESSYILVTQCHYFIGRHFLARYLKTRCLIDCNRSNSEIIREFKQLKSNLPFEHMMCCTLWQKLRQL